MQKLLIVFVCLISGCVTLTCAGIVGVGFLVETHVIPDTAAFPGEELRAKDVAWLVEEGFLPPGESIVYFYSDGFLSIAEDGNFFTEHRVVSYFTDPSGELVGWWAEYAEIQDIQVQYADGFLSNSIVTIVCHDDTWFELVVSNDEGGDEVFVERLLARWRSARDS